MAGKATRKATPNKDAAATKTMTTRTRRSKAASSSVVESKQVTHDMVAQKAYELWRQRGGDAESNWYEAEHLLYNSH